MHFLIDASLPRSTIESVTRRGYLATDVRDIGMSDAPDGEIAAHAKRHTLVILTADFDFADIRVYPPGEYHGIVVIERPENATVRQTRMIVDRVLGQRSLVAQLQADWSSPTHGIRGCAQSDGQVESRQVLAIHALQGNRM